MVHVFRTLDHIGPGQNGAALTIGNFDGVHVAHQSIMRRVVEVARQRGLVPSVLTFEPHPTRVLAPARAPQLLSTPQERIDLMEQQGIEQVFILPFDRDFSALSAEDFVKRILVDHLRAHAVMVGANFRFGHKQSGDVRKLEQLGDRYGFSTEILPGVTVRGRLVSSSQVRSLVLAGDVNIACRLLGRPYSVEGHIVSGHGIGSRQTVPTLNLQTAAEIIPATGVYITRTEELSGTRRKWESITNVGFRPTFDGDKLTIETFLLQPYDGNAPQSIRLSFLRRVRGERKFDSAEALKTQILKDVAGAQKYFRRLHSIIRA